MPAPFGPCFAARWLGACGDLGGRQGGRRCVEEGSLGRADLSAPNDQRAGSGGVGLGTMRAMGDMQRARCIPGCRSGGPLPTSPTRPAHAVSFISALLRGGWHLPNAPAPSPGPPSPLTAVSGGRMLQRQGCQRRHDRTSRHPDTCARPPSPPLPPWLSSRLRRCRPCTQPHVGCHGTQPGYSLHSNAACIQNIPRASAAAVQLQLPPLSSTAADAAVLVNRRQLTRWCPLRPPSPGCLLLPPAAHTRLCCR